MDARLTQACALVQAKPRTIDEIALALKTTKGLGSMLIGRLIAAGVLVRNGDSVSVADAVRAKAIVAGEVDKLPMKKRKKKPKTNGAAPPPEAIVAGEDATVCFGKDEDGYLIIARRDGEGSPMLVAPGELTRLLAYVRANFKEAAR